MRICTPFSIAFASVLFTFTLAKRLDKESSGVDIYQAMDNQDVRSNIYKKREIRKRLPRRNSKSEQHPSYLLAARSDSDLNIYTDPSNVGGLTIKYDYSPPIGTSPVVVSLP